MAAGHRSTTARPARVARSSDRGGRPPARRGGAWRKSRSSDARSAIGVLVGVRGACAAARSGRPVRLLRQRSQAAEPSRARRLSPQAGDAHPRSQRRRRSASSGSEKRTVVPYRRDPQDAGQRGGRRRGRRLLQARRPRLPGHGARLHRERAARAAGAGRLDDHAAGGEDAAADARADAAPQGAGDHPRPAAVAEAVEGGGAGALPEPDLLRPRPLRLRGGGALLLRQVGARDQPRRGGAAGRAAAEPGAAVAAQAPRGGQDAPALRAGAAWPSTASSSARRPTSWPPSRSAWRARPRAARGMAAEAVDVVARFLADKLGERTAFEVGHHGRHDDRRAACRRWRARRWSAGSRSWTRARASAGRRAT